MQFIVTARLPVKRPAEAPDDDDTRSTTAPLTVGAHLRRVRKARTLSLAEVAEATGISASFLSLVEKDRSDITIGRLVRLIEFYGISITDLVPGGVSTGYPEVVTPAERRFLHSPAEGIDVYLLTADTRHQMMPLQVELQPGARLAEYGRHAGEEWVIVISGELVLELEGAEPRLLKPGDSAYYPAERPHLFSNASDDGAAQPDLRRHAADDVTGRRHSYSGSPFERTAAYARAVRGGDLVAVSGTAATGPDGRALDPGDVYAQTADAIARGLESVVELGGAAADVVRTRIFLAPGADWREAVRAHAEAFAGVDPANTTLFVAGFIPEDVLVEVELDAVVS